LLPEVGPLLKPLPLLPSKLDTGTVFVLCENAIRLRRVMSAVTMVPSWCALCRAATSPPVPAPPRIRSGCRLQHALSAGWINSARARRCDEGGGGAEL